MRPSQQEAVERQRQHADDPDAGHRFRISATSAMASRVVGEHATDSPFDDEVPPFVVVVRAHDLSTALRRAAELPLSAWSMEDGDPL